jgi:hypothetical protein
MDYDLEGTIIGLERLGKKIDSRWGARGANADIFEVVENAVKSTAYLAVSPFVIASFVEDFDDAEPGTLLVSSALIIPAITSFEYSMYDIYLHNYINNPYLLPAVFLFSNGLSLGKEILKHKGILNYASDKFERLTNW